MALARDGAMPAFATTGGTLCEALEPARLAAPFEALRDAADGAGERPRIVLARLGGPSDFTARATFAQNFFEAGGIEAVTGGDDFDLDGATVACLCSSDAVYAEKAAEAAQALKAAGATRVYLAGRPDEALSAAGIDGFIFAGCDVIECFEDLHSHLGVTP
jgi:methylmalonyl-CoA mutase